jgi:transcriptional regulator with XRE-family HTH domain
MTLESEAFGKHIRKLRNEKGLSLRQFAKQIDISPAYLSYIERGVQGVPSTKIVKKLAEGLDTNQDALLAMTGKIDSSVTQAFMEHLDKLAPESNEFKTEKEAGQAVVELLNFLVLQSSFNEMLDLKGTPQGNAVKTYGELHDKLNIDGGLPKHNEKALLAHFEEVIRLWREDFDK